MSKTLKVLIIEGSPNVRLSCEQAMQRADIGVEYVASAEGAKRRIAIETPGVVISDMCSPGFDGLAFLRWSHDRDPALPVIMITGHGDVTLAVEVMRNGAYDFIPKPFSPELLVEVIGRAMETRLR